MADTETTTATPNEAQPVAEAAPVEQTVATEAQKAQLLEVIEELAAVEPATEAAPLVPGTEAPKKDGGYEPLGNVVNLP
ncbi:hypothetical protein ACIRPK_30235 [Kitasatospora sp. NPDC101801]|uniref:hypothetical protein n=1 Tax=Kitasatospora sp. NPDC101801 TaxID=3364103 RepID=UPI00381F4B0D